jgi:uncharacterized protein
MTTPIEQVASLAVGIVESVAPHQFTVLLDLNAPHALALNTGSPTPFPRLNGYVLVPNEAGATVGYVAWVGIERSPYPKRAGLKDFGLVDLPFPLRKMLVCPVGTLTSRRERGQMSWHLARGVSAFPSVGDQVLMPTGEQIAAIVGGAPSERRVRLGTSPMAGGIPVLIDPDRLLGRHLAVLGNTGSGKSCTVASLIRGSMAAAAKELGEGVVPNMRFVVLDPNGEYARAFADMPQRVRVFTPAFGDKPLVVPAWMWNSHEWSAVTHAQPGVQRPLLMQALRDLRAGRAVRDTIEVTIVRQVRLYRNRTLALINDGTGASYMDYVGQMNCCQMFSNVQHAFQAFHQEAASSAPVSPHLLALSDAAQRFVDSHKELNQRSGKTYYTAANVAEFRAFLPLFEAIERALPAVAALDEVTEDAPVPFDVTAIADHVDALSAEAATNANMANFVATLSLRIRSMVSDRRIAPIINPPNPINLGEWLVDVLGSSDGSNGQVVVIDLSLVPSEVMHIVVAVLGRLVFEASQRHRKHDPKGLALPTALVLEEAHAFVRRGDDNDAGAGLCRETFERIAREGRKFGVGLVLSSQRPSELSPTVLAQCNTFILHRLVNEADQDLVARLVPDNVGGLLKELPSLPSRQAVLLGWATPLPVLIEMDELVDDHRPQSADPDFWNVWTRRAERKVDWETVAETWSKGQ